MAIRRKTKTAKVRHPFLYRLENGDGTSKVRKAWATVDYATKEVQLKLTADHVRKSMRANGVGNTSTCSMALCTYDHAEAFPHPVEGHVDWQYSRAFVVTKVDKQGLPSRCRVYEHDDRGVAKLNDTKGGQQKLLDIILRDGPITVTLKPHRVRSKAGRSGKGRPRVGTRDPVSNLKGAKLRYAVYKLGATPV